MCVIYIYMYVYIYSIALTDTFGMGSFHDMTPELGLAGSG